MTPEQLRISRIVCAALEVNGWKEGQRCPDRRVKRLVGEWFNPYCVEHNRPHGHILEPPDIFSPAGAWMLLEALVNEGIYVTFKPDNGGIEFARYKYDRLETILGTTNPVLAQAALAYVEAK